MLDQQDTATTGQTAAVIADDPLAEPTAEASPEPAAIVAPALGGKHREERLATDPHAYRFDVAGPTRGRRHGVVGVVASAATWLTKPVKM